VDVIHDELREIWDDDAEVYDEGSDHRLHSRAEQAAWTAALARLLPAEPARVLDVGAGTGFVSLLAARLGHRVTALDLSPRMLDRLADKASAEGLGIDVVQGSAEQPPDGPFEAVIERHLTWTLPDPAAALAAWRLAAPAGRLVLLESLWDDAADPLEAVRARVRARVHRLRRDPAGHQHDYPEGLRSRLPLGRGTAPDELLAAVVAGGWPAPRLERLRDVEWATRLGLPTLDRLLGVRKRFVVVSG
jgi:ubiquinone/menaquinone biosynthesis C-methylase UbiE